MRSPRGLDPSERDEWSACGIKTREDVYDRFVPHFFFGCEGDDRMTSLAFDSKRNPLGARLNAVYGSDMGHYDLTDLRNAAVEAYESVDDGLMSEEDFRDFVFVNPIKLHAGMNANFFRGTILEHEAEKVLVDLGAKEDVRQITSTTATN